MHACLLNGMMRQESARPYRCSLLNLSPELHLRADARSRPQPAARGNRGAGRHEERRPDRAAHLGLLCAPGSAARHCTTQTSSILPACHFCSCHMGTAVSGQSFAAKQTLMAPCAHLVALTCWMRRCGHILTSYPSSHQPQAPGTGVSTPFFLPCPQATARSGTRCSRRRACLTSACSPRWTGWLRRRARGASRSPCRCSTTGRRTAASPSMSGVRTHSPFLMSFGALSHAPDDASISSSSALAAGQMPFTHSLTPDTPLVEHIGQAQNGPGISALQPGQPPCQGGGTPSPDGSHPLTRGVP